MLLSHWNTLQLLFVQCPSMVLRSQRAKCLVACEEAHCYECASILFLPANFEVRLAVSFCRIAPVHLASLMLVPGMPPGLRRLLLVRCEVAAV